MRKTFDDLHEWVFEIDEVSNGVYRAIGRGPSGENVSFSGIDPDEVLRICREKALHI